MAKSRPHNLHRRSDRESSSTPTSHRRPPATAHKEPHPQALPPADQALHELTALSRTLFDTPDESEILRLAMDHIAAAGPYSAEAGYLLEADGGLVPSAKNRQDHALTMDRKVRDLAGQDGPVAVPGRPRGQALGLRGLEGLHGYLVVTCRSRPTEAEQSLLAVLIQHTAAALSVAFAHRRRREEALELHRLREARAALQRQLIAVVAELAYRRAVHALMAHVAAAGGHEEAVTRALHGLTGLPALVEDRFGRLRSWAGPSRPDPYPEPDPVRQDALLNAAAREAGPARIKGRLIALVRQHGEVLGMLALVDPQGEADEHTVLALEQAATSLAPELAHLRNLAEVELRLHRELADDLLAGTDETSAYARSEAVGHDLHRSHYIVVVQWSDRAADDSFAQTVGRAASAVGMRSLLTRRAEHVVLLADDRPHARALYEALTLETGAPSGSIGVSARCDSPGDIPQHYREAQRALEVRRHALERYGMTFFDQLGLYRILGPGNDFRELEAFVHEWLGQLIDYDARNNSAMAETLARYFDCGGNYDETAASLSIHRSTLRYRLQRIREISGNDLANVEDRLNLQVATRVWKIVLGESG
ncbi:helix-turn-helix domain-containing protein [Streptomyces sp. M3]|uniref:PucR family transcriptional regulator n=1 Tax=Streptomyces sp. M3 TaxID=295102 RepID=UPI00100F6719|nr:helix-turn-helix domain-containing protein [Streptomyces sp. M3]